MAPHYDDPQSMEGFQEAVRDTAYFLWEEAGRPEGRADEFWYKALEIHYRSRAYGIWMRQMEAAKAAQEEDETEPIGDISGTDLSEEEALNLADGVEHERDA
jgi:hypothetical protein